MKAVLLTDIGYKTLTNYRIYENGDLLVPGRTGKYVNKAHKQDKILSPSTNYSNGKKKYASFHISFNGKHHYLNVHRLLALAFIPNPEGLAEVNHIDNDRHNFKLSNLEWVSRKGNDTHAREFGVDFSQSDEAVKATRQRMLGNTYGVGTISTKRKLTIQDAEDIRNKYIPRKYSQRMLAKEYGVNQVTISNILKGKTYAN